jgi:hypothetical protein
MKTSLGAILFGCAFGVLACGSDGGGGGGTAGGGTGGTGGGGTAGGGDAPTFANVQKIMTQSCSLSTSCHKGMRPKANLNLEEGMAYMQLMGDGTAGVASCEFPMMKRVVPGNPAMSLLIAKLGTPPSGMVDAACTSAGGKNDRMPMSNDMLPPAQIQLISDWITMGAKP